MQENAYSAHFAVRLRKDLCALLCIYLLEAYIAISCALVIVMKQRQCSRGKQKVEQQPRQGNVTSEPVLSKFALTQNSVV